MKLPFNIDHKIKDIIKIDAKDLKIRKKIDIYSAKNDNEQNCIYLYISQKSRVLQKEVEKVEEIYNKIKEYTKTDYENRVIFIDAPLCSKAKTKFEENGWSILI